RAGLREPLGDEARAEVDVDLAQAARPGVDEAVRLLGFDDRHLARMQLVLRLPVVDERGAFEHDQRLNVGVALRSVALAAAGGETTRGASSPRPAGMPRRARPGRRGRAGSRVGGGGAARAAPLMLVETHPTGTGSAPRPVWARTSISWNFWSARRSARTSSPR